MLMRSFPSNSPQCHLDLGLNKYQILLKGYSYYDSWHGDPAVTEQGGLPWGCLWGQRSHTVMYNTCSPCFRFYFKGFTYRVHFLKLEVRLVKELAQGDSPGEGKAMLRPGQPPLPKCTVHELCTCVHLPEHPCLPSSCLAPTLQPPHCSRTCWKLAADLLTGFLSGQLRS